MKTRVAEFRALQDNKSLCVRTGSVKLVLVKTGGVRRPRYVARWSRVVRHAPGLSSSGSTFQVP